MNKLLFLVVFCFSLHDYGQQPFSYSFNEEVDLQSQTIYDIYEDSQFNIWIGTNEGLYKWDGLNLNQFKDVRFSLAYSNIQESENGLIWFQNFSGQIFYIAESKIALHEDLNAFVSGFIDFSVEYFPQIYYFTEFGLFESNYKSQKKKKYNYNLPFSEKDSVSNPQNKMFEDPLSTPSKSENGFFCTARSKPINFDIRSKIFTDCFEDRSLWPDRAMMTFSIQKNMVFCFAKNNYNTCFYRRFNDDSWQRVTLNEEVTVNISAVYYNENQQFVLIGHSQGLLKINLTDNTCSSIMSGVNVSRIIIDREENVWLATLNQGLIILPNLDNISFELESAKNYFLVVDDRLLIINNLGKIFRYENQQIKEINDLNKAHDIGQPQYNPFAKIIFFEKAQEVYSPKENNFSLTNQEIGHKEKNHLSKDVWLECMSNSFSINAKTKEDLIKFNNFPPQNAVTSKLDNYDQFRTILRDKRCYSSCLSKDKSELYAAFSDGLYMFKNNEQTEIFFGSERILTNKLVESTDAIWFANSSNEMLRLKNGKIEIVLKTENRITTFAVAENHLFVGTINGLVKFDRSSKKITHINQTDGLTSNYIDEIAVHHDSVFINTLKGINVFPVDFESINAVPPKIEMVSVKVNEKLVNISNLKTLTYHENNLYFEFKSINQKARGSHSYLYKLEGIDSAWQIQNGSIKFCRYPSLPPGNYNFLLKAKNEDGYECELQSIPIKIEDPFYQTWWFYLLISLSLVLLVSIGFIIRIRILKHRGKLLSAKKEIEKELSKSQLSALKSQMNPHFVFNALNSIQDYIINNNKELASDYLGLFADLMRKYLNLSQEDYISLDEEVETLNMYLKLEKVRFEETLAYTVNYDENLDLSAYLVPTMLVQPFVENSIKHGLLHKEGDRILSVNFEVINETLIIKIKDNGIGRAKSQELQQFRSKDHKSFATCALHERLKLINESGDYEININYTDLMNPTGTEVEIRIIKK